MVIYGLQVASEITQFSSETSARNYLVILKRSQKTFQEVSYLSMCPSSQSLYFSSLSQVAGRALAPSLHPNRAPATAPLVSASPPWKQHQTTERGVTSRYHGSKISGSQQSFLTETAICIVERGKKRMGYSLFLSAIMHKKVIHVKSLFVCLFSSIFAGQQFIEITRSCATMLTWRNDVYGLYRYVPLWRVWFSSSLL